MANLAQPRNVNQTTDSYELALQANVGMSRLASALQADKICVAISTEEGVLHEIKILSSLDDASRLISAAVTDPSVKMLIAACSTSEDEMIFKFLRTVIQEAANSNIRGGRFIVDQSGLGSSLLLTF